MSKLLAHLVLPREEGWDEGDEEDGDVCEQQHGQHLAQPEQVVAESAGAAPHHVTVHHQHHYPSITTHRSYFYHTDDIRNSLKIHKIIDPVKTKNSHSYTLTLKHSNTLTLYH